METPFSSHLQLWVTDSGSKWWKSYKLWHKGENDKRATKKIIWGNAEASDGKCELYGQATGSLKMKVWPLICDNNIRKLQSGYVYCSAVETGLCSETSALCTAVHWLWSFLLWQNQQESMINSSPWDLSRRGWKFAGMYMCFVYVYRNFARQKWGHLCTIPNHRKVSMILLAKSMFKQQLNGLPSKFSIENHIYFGWYTFRNHGVRLFCVKQKTVCWDDSTVSTLPMNCRPFAKKELAINKILFVEKYM